MKKVYLIAALFSLVTLGRLYAQFPGVPNGLLWKVSGNGLKQASFLLFTSICCDETIRLNDTVQRALKNVRAIALEDNRADKSNLVKLQRALVAQSDSQRVRDILPGIEYRQFVNKFKDAGVSDQVVDQLNNMKAFAILKLLQVDANPCGNRAPGRIEDVLKKYAAKNNIAYREFFTIEDIMAEVDAQPKEYWRQNLEFTLKTPDLVSQAFQNRRALYESNDLAGITELYRTNSYYRLTFNDIIYKRHVETLASKIDSLIKQEPSLIAINVSNIYAGGVSIIDVLHGKGYTVQPADDQ